VSTHALWVVRHPPVVATGICYGQSDVPLAVDVHTAAATILEAVRAAGIAVERVLSSPWKRAHDVAAELAPALGVPHEVDARLSEMSFGVWEGRAFAEIETTDGERFFAWMNDWRRAAAPEGERVDDLVARADAFRRDHAARGGVVLAVTHAGLVRALRSIVRGVDYEAVVREAVPPLALERIGSRS
jgi:alpha-ribazole phosphatase